MATIRLEQVRKWYGNVEAVRELNLNCDDGELLALLGPSGCGKSSTLKMIAGIETVSEGEIYFDKRPVSSLTPGERNIAMVFEDYALYPHLTVAENIAFPLRIRRVPSVEIETKVRDTLDLLGMQELRNVGVQRLSGGAQQRVAIGRAFVREPELILFDEPLSHLDGDHKVKLRGEIRRLQKEKGLTSIVVTHDQTEAIAMADRVAVMNLGVLNQVGTPQELYDHPTNAFVAEFIGEPPMNLLHGELIQSGNSLAFQADCGLIRFKDDFASQLVNIGASKNLILGIRPEHVSLVPDTGERIGSCRMSGRIFFRELRGDVDVLQINLQQTTDHGFCEKHPVENTISVEVASEFASLAQGRLEVSFPEHHLHFFDAGTGKSVFRRCNKQLMGQHEPSCANKY